MKTIAIAPVRQPFNRSLRVPGSKSITNRALPLAAMADGPSTLRGILFADDTRQMMRALQTLGYRLQIDQAQRTVALQGCGPAIPTRQANLVCGNSGTTIRFLAALCGIAEGDYVLDNLNANIRA